MGYRLCGGTFFTLLTNVKRPNSQKKRYHGNEIKVSEAIMLDKLVCLLNEEHANLSKKNIGSITSKFKNCSISVGSNIPLDDSAYSDAYDKKIKENYPTALEEMEEYCSFFLQIESPDLMDQLVRSLLELISFDGTIPEDATFYALPDGSTIKKKELIVSSEILIPALLVGIWHYIVKNVHDNTVGAETIRDWQLEKQYKNQTAKLRDHIGDSIKQDIRIETKCSSLKRIQNIVNSPQPTQSSPLAVEEDRTYDAYLAKIRNRYDKVKTLIYGESPRELESFFICNKIVVYGPSSHPLNYVGPVTAQGLRFVSQYAILTGTGGLGKTMMMKHFLLMAIENYNEIGSLPIFVDLKEFKKGSDILSFIYEQIVPAWDKTKEDLKNLIASKSTLLLLDGLDEMRSNLLDTFHQKITRFIEEYPLSQIIMSSRPFSRFIEYNKFTLVKLCPFSKDQSLELIHKLDFRPDSPKIKENFEKELDRKLYDTHKEFAENPLLLTIMLMTYEQFAEVPSKMHVFYERAYLTLAKEHDANKGAYSRTLRTGLQTDEFLRCISRFSAMSYWDEKFEFSRTDIERYMEKLLSRNDVEKINITLDNFIYDLCYSLCLMYYEGRLYHFIHRSFQEYFCALFFSHQMDEELLGISHFFEKGNDSIRNHRFNFLRGDDKTFGMLYEMIPEKIEKYVFLPTLERFFVEYDKKDGYWTFLLQMYNEIPYTVGPSNLGAECDSKSFLFRFIAQKKGFYHDMLEDIRIPNPSDDFQYAKFYLIGYKNEKGDDVCEVIDEDELFKYDPDEDTILDTGYYYRISIDDLMDSPDLFTELRAYLESSECPYHTEYEAARRYYQELKNKYSQRSEDIFDRLTW